jgi:polysaccharide export outer membrane protein
MIMMATNTKARRSISQASVWLLASAILCGAQSAPQPTPVSGNAPTAAVLTKADSKSDAQFLTRNPRYTIRSADTFDVNFELSPEFNQSVTVQPDGFITLKGVGDVHVAGQTVPELTQTLRNAYDKILNDPLISVVLKDFERPYFTASGQLNHPGLTGMPNTRRYYCSDGSMTSGLRPRFLT